MFVIGALDPRVGNDRRNQLIQQLMQQYSGQGGGQLGLPATNLMRQTPTFGVFGAAARESSANAPGGTPQFTGGNPISSALDTALGPGGRFRAPGSFMPGNIMSPAPGVPAPAFGGPPGRTHGFYGGGPFAPGLPTTSGPPGGGGGGNPAVYVPPNGGGGGNPAVYIPPQSVPGSPTPSGHIANPSSGGAVNPMNGSGPGSSVIGQGIARALGLGGAGPSPTTSTGLVPLGGGVFYQPGVGVVGTPMGGLGGGPMSLMGGGRVLL